MTAPYDILIVGAGPAGCAAAYDLAKAGRRVLLLEKRTFPRHKACACGLTRKTLAALRYSVDPVIERVCYEIVLQSTTTPGAPSSPTALSSAKMGPKPHEVRVRTRVPRRALLLGGVATRTPICAMAVRESFDAFCLQKTLSAGAELLKIESVAAIHESPNSIALDIVTAGGPRTLHAAALIGADGSNGQTRRLTHAKADPAWYTHGFALEATVPFASLPATLPCGDIATDLVFDFAPLPGGYGWLFPKADHINIGVGAFAPSSDTTQLKAVTRVLLLDYARQKLGVTTLDHITGQALGMGGHAYVPHGRVLLTGDAAGLVDPLTGEGIHSAIVSGQAAAAAILEAMPALKPSETMPALKQSETMPASKQSEAMPALKGTGFSPSNKRSEEMGALAPEALAAAYARHLRPLQQTLAFSYRAARAFYATPSRGLKAMRNPLLRPLILSAYANGIPHPRLITTLAKLLT